jgi:hypothetical protein
MVPVRPLAVSRHAIRRFLGRALDGVPREEVPELLQRLVVAAEISGRWEDVMEGGRIMRVYEIDVGEVVYACVRGATIITVLRGWQRDYNRNSAWRRPDGSAFPIGSLGDKLRELDVV